MALIPLELSTNIKVVRDALQTQRNSILMTLSRYPGLQKKKLEEIDFALECLQAIEKDEYVLKHPERNIAKEKPHIFGHQRKELA